MCGIAGFIGPENRTASDLVTAALAHRGPDGSGYWHSSDVSLTLLHRRLSILDLQGGHQPMSTPDAHLTVSFNGEIYNFPELRRELESLGHHFRTQNSDTEVLLYGYQEWGADLFEKLNGMFAFALYDAKIHTLILARDRFGEKPLYIYCQNKTFAFASEVVGLKYCPGVRLNVSPVGIRKYFAFGFCPDSTSCFINMAQLRPGHYVSLDLRAPSTAQNWQSLAKPFSTFRLEPTEQRLKGNDAQITEEFWHLFVQSTRRRLQSNVPVGLLLSGGVDSSAVLAALHDIGIAHKTPCVSIGVSHPDFDETRYAQHVANHFKAPLRVKRFDPETMISHGLNVLDHMSEPLADASLLPTALLCQTAVQDVKVALSGDGGDELLAGYSTFKALRYLYIAKCMGIEIVSPVIERLLNLVPKRTTYMSLDFKIAQFLKGLHQERPNIEQSWMAPIAPQDLLKAFGTEISKEDIFAELYEFYDTLREFNRLDQSLMYFTRFYLTDNILAKSDRMSMRHSLETRSVFLDNDLANFLQQIPQALKMHRHKQKVILKNALEQRLPRSILNRSKQGFGIPMTNWLVDACRSITSRSEVPFVNSQFFHESLQDHIDGHHNNRLFLFAYLSAQRAL